jgi:predicted transcriptional regulator
MSMYQMLLSINPEHVENILNGTKHYEFRKTRCRESINKILIYSTAPEKMVVAEALIEDVIVDTIDAVWQMTYELAGISREFYEAYYKGKDKAVAYRLGEVKKFLEPKALSDYGLRCAPQSFAYVEATR